MEPLLEIKNLSVDFLSPEGPVPALRNISFSVHRGEIVALVGESGSGKSVTSLAILQLLPTPPARYLAGDIRFTREPGTSLNLLKATPAQLQKLRGNRMAMIFQDPMSSLNPVMTCGRQVAEAIRLHQGLARPRAEELALHWLERVRLPRPGQLMRRYPHQLSGGQQQRVMIAMAMACQPDLLICDEPTTALDVTVQKTILSLLRELQQERDMGVIFITHDLGVVAEIADRALVMYRGEILEQGPVASLFREPAHPYTRALLACRPILHPRGQPLPVVEDFLGNRPVPMQPPVVGEQPAIPPAQPAEREVLVQVDQLRVQYPAGRNWLGRPRRMQTAVDGVSFDLFRHEVLGLVGESGCGKTTLGRTLLRLVEPSGGTIRFRGQDLTGRSQQDLRGLRRDVQLVFQDPYSSLNPRLSVGEAIMEPMKVHGLASRRERRERAIALLEKVNLRADHFHRYPHSFSGGQRQRIVIARALALEPSFLVCDESVSALDVSVQAQVLNLLNELKRELDLTMLFISHDLAVVHYISDRILVMQEGRIVESGPADQVFYHPHNPYTQALLAALPGRMPA
ncbi:MAG TPA: ABC transporter ATP-binding protein [Chitinophagaceae bacterium]|nr:ABC transporter ATP-binding protein [Chitinophagaceae bacterium]